MCSRWSDEELLGKLLRNRDADGLGVDGRMFGPEMRYSRTGMSNEQIIAIAVPMAFNGAIIGLLGLWMKARFESVDERFKGINQRFDDVRDFWRAELHRVEGVLDARLTHIEERSR
jgi:hypothetical protein